MRHHSGHDRYRSSYAESFCEQAMSAKNGADGRRHRNPLRDDNPQHAEAQTESALRHLRGLKCDQPVTIQFPQKGQVTDLKVAGDRLPSTLI